MQALNLSYNLIGLFSIKVAKALFNNVTDHRMDEPVNELWVLKLSDGMLDHIALGGDEVSDFVNSAFVEHFCHFLNL